MRRSRIKTEQKPEQKIEQNDSPVSVIDYGPEIKQPPIHLQVPEPEEEEISITEEELNEFIRQKEGKNLITPSVQPQIQQAGNSIMGNVMNTLLTTVITTLTPVIILMGMKKYGECSNQSQQPSQEATVTNSSKHTPKANIAKFSPFTGQN